MRFIPKSAVSVASKKSPAIAYLYVSSGGRFCAIGYFGKAEKSSFNYGWRDLAKRNAYVAQWLQSCDARVAAKQVRQAEEKAKRAEGHKLVLGSVLRSMWGCDQTNVDYYQVVALRGKRQVVIRAIGAEAVDSPTLSMQGQSVPLKDSFKGPEMIKSVSSRGDSVRIASYASAYLMEPVKSAGGLELGFKPSHWTAYA